MFVCSNQGVKSKQRKLAGDCDDDHEQCVEWAFFGECEKNPGFMNATCKKSCGLCPGSKKVSLPTSMSRYRCQSCILGTLAAHVYPHCFDMGCCDRTCFPLCHTSLCCFSEVDDYRCMHGALCGVRMVHCVVCAGAYPSGQEPLGVTARTSQRSTDSSASIQLPSHADAETCVHTHSARRSQSIRSQPTVLHT